MMSQLSYIQQTPDIIAVNLPPPLKWAGGKRWLIPHLRPLWARNTHRCLVEPFVGGMAVALGLQPTKARLHDRNPHLINFYRWLQRGLVITIPMANDEGLYYCHRQRFNALIQAGEAETVEAASLFYYLNRTGYNGLCRFNSKGEFNVPFGRYTIINYTRDFTPYVKAVQNWELTYGDFDECMLQSNDFVYADPPYDVEFTSYSPGGFRWEDQVRLAEWLAAHPGPVVASNQATERIVDLYTQLRFTITILEAPRMIACTGDRTPAQELLATKGV